MSTPDLPPVPPPPPPAAPVPVPAKKSKTLVIVLCVILGIFLLLVASCVGTCLYAGKKLKNYSEESKKNPQISAISVIAAVTPGVEVVSKDLDAGTIVLKNKKTGETVKLDSNNFSQQKMESVLEKLAQGNKMAVSTNSGSSSSASTTPDNSSASSSSGDAAYGPTISAGKASALQAMIKGFGPDFPLYDSGGAKTLDATQNSFAGISSSEYSFTTSDSPGKVADYYSKALGDAGYTTVSSANGSDNNGETASRVFQKDGLASTYNFTAQIEDGKTHVSVTRVLLGKK